MFLDKILEKYRSEILENYNNGLNQTNFHKLIKKLKKRNLFQKILTLFRKDEVFKGSIRSIEAYILYSIIRRFNIKKILEIGTGKGYSALVCSSALKKNNQKDSKIFSIDIQDSNKNYNIGKIFQLFNLKNFVNFIVGDSHDVLTTRNLQNEKFQFVIIDGHHSYEHTKKELELIKHIVSDKYIVFMDDIFKKKSKSVYDSMIEFKEETDSEILFIDEKFYDKFNFKEDNDDVLRQSIKWKNHNYYYLKNENPKNKSAIIFVNFSLIN